MQIANDTPINRHKITWLKLKAGRIAVGLLFHLILIKLGGYQFPYDTIMVLAKDIVSLHYCGGLSILMYMYMWQRVEKYECLSVTLYRTIRFSSHVQFVSAKPG